MSVKFVGAAILTLLLLAGVFVTVWQVDDHFITRREFERAMQQVDANFREINRHMGTRHHAVDGQDAPPDP